MPPPGWRSLKSIELQENEGHLHGRSLVSIDKGVVARNAKGVRGGKMAMVSPASE